MRIIERDRVFIRAGCFVKGYTPGCTTYAERNLLKPTAIGHVRLDITFKKAYSPEKWADARHQGATVQEASRNHSRTNSLTHAFKVTL
jgi:hypothetical protein